MGGLRALAAAAAALALQPAVRGQEAAGEHPVVVLSPGIEAFQPDVAVSADGKSVWACFAGGPEGKSDIWVVRSDDQGANFGDPVKAVDCLAALRGMGCQRGPRIGVDGNGRVYVSIHAELDIRQAKGKYPTPDLWLATSTDGGKSFGKPVRVNDGGKTVNEGMHAMAVAGDGTVHLVWLDQRGAKKGSTLFAARVTDAGAKVSKNTPAYLPPEGTVCECCAPNLALDSKGNPVIAFRNKVQGARDAWVAFSQDGGKTYKAVGKVGTGTWKAPS
ncbi:MAG: glycoside hydrolase [Planctomycetales bacterium]|nr:glycoside hydrolase [Planctomycetales bacterium]